MEGNKHIKPDTRNYYAKRIVAPEKLIKEYDNVDVLFGRGNGTNHHPGNKNFRRLIKENKCMYAKSKIGGKSEIALVIKNMILNAGGRFLEKYTAEDGSVMWEVLDDNDNDKRINCKICQALREIPKHIKAKRRLDLKKNAMMNEAILEQQKQIINTQMLREGKMPINMEEYKKMYTEITARMIATMNREIADMEKIISDNNKKIAEGKQTLQKRNREIETRGDVPPIAIQDGSPQQVIANNNLFTSMIGGQQQDQPSPSPLPQESSLEMSSSSSRSTSVVSSTCVSGDEDPPKNNSTIGQQPSLESSTSDHPNEISFSTRKPQADEEKPSSPSVEHQTNLDELEKASPLYNQEESKNEIGGERKIWNLHEMEIYAVINCQRFNAISRQFEFLQD